MGWLGKIISKVKNTKYADVMTGQVPIFSQFGRDIYVSDVVQQAIECIANEMSKLEPCFIRGVGNDYQTPENDVYQIQNLLDNPNPIMTKSARRLPAPRVWLSAPTMKRPRTRRP